MDYFPGSDDLRPMVRGVNQILPLQRNNDCMAIGTSRQQSPQIAALDRSVASWRFRTCKIEEHRSAAFEPVAWEAFRRERRRIYSLQGRAAQ
ncbi:hypothetical protein [Mesorhizobium sp.]|uniref:hypothetical protein n=1 Tax=Mesorhizobium sp. TaxID=1871066 RepID=UPI0025E56AB4|nr:hypothetical protein [Mesorhizobium sp.]